LLYGLVRHHLWKVTFISKQNFANILSAVLCYAVYPSRETFERGQISQIKYKNNTHSTFVKILSYWAKALLTSCIPNL
jgi:hypothetical protein